jgi:hypothetical protein
MAYGIRRLVDAQQNFTRAAGPVYLRLRNFPDIQETDWAALGFSIAPTGTSEIGTMDILINPPASVIMISLRTIGQSMGKLRFGARTFLVSHTFVKAQMAAQGIFDPTYVWRGPNVVGLRLNRQLFSIEDYWHEEISAQTVTWGLTCNSLELPVTGPNAL